MGAHAIDIRVATPEDAGALLGLKRVLDHETRFMVLEPGERTATETDVAEELRSITAQPNSVVLVADAEGELVGYVEANGGSFRRTRHTAYVVIGIRRSHAGLGIGSQLLSALESWAASAGVLRLELTVMTSNERAVGLYRKLGYHMEGTRRAALMVDNELGDEFWMAKLVNPDARAQIP